MKEHHQCRYHFWRWLICLAMKNSRIYWLLWGMLVVVAICAWQFGLAGVLTW